MTRRLGLLGLCALKILIISLSIFCFRREAEWQCIHLVRNPLIAQDTPWRNVSFKQRALLLLAKNKPLGMFTKKWYVVVMFKTRWLVVV